MYPPPGPLALFGGVVGLEREIRLKGAGIRTHIIVSLASCLMMLVSKYGFFDVLVSDSIRLDPSRVAAGIVTAIGFLGAGTIFSRGQNITGLTTAAGIWATVGIGMSVGAGMYLISAVATVMILIIQALLHKDLSILVHSPTVIDLTLDDTPEVAEWLENALVQTDLAIDARRYAREHGILSVQLELKHRPGTSAELSERLQPLTRDPRVKSIRW